MPNGMAVKNAPTARQWLHSRCIMLTMSTTPTGPIPAILWRHAVRRSNVVRSGSTTVPNAANITRARQYERRVMSDHRFEVKIEFSIYGQSFDWDASLNWSPNDFTGVDYRLIDWFADCYVKARAGYDHQNMIEDQARDWAKTEALERAQLARLKAKYEGDASASPVSYTDTYGGEPNSLTGPWGHMNLDGSSVQWIEPTPVGDFSATGITCRYCGHVVTMKPGDVIQRGDPRLCNHLGGPSSPWEKERVARYWSKDDLGDDPDGDNS